MTVYVCEDSLEGVFTGIYRAYEDRLNQQETFLSLSDEPVLFADMIRVEPDAERTGKVVGTLRRRFGEDDYISLCMALSARDPSKAQAVYRTVANGIAKNLLPGHLFDDLADDQVHRTFSLARGAGREIDHLRGFIRFQELEEGILFASMAPKNDILTFLMPHFSDRLPGENFVIFDESRNVFGVHPADRQWYLLQGEEAYRPVLRTSDREEEYSGMFRSFCRAIAICERYNPGLQRNLLPMRFREYMTEFRSKC